MKAVIGAAAMAALALAKRQEDCTATVTTYLPFEQHRCASFHVLDYGQEVPDGACEAGACCLSIEEGHGPGIVLVDDECQQEGNGQREGHGHRETGAREYIPGRDTDYVPIRTTSVPHDNITTTLTTVLTTPVATDTVEVISSTLTTNAVVTTTSDVVVTTTTTNSKGETTTAVITTETTDVITTPMTTVEEITTTKQITTSEVITTTTVIISDIPEEPTDVPMDIPEPQVPMDIPGPQVPEDPICPRPTCELGVEMALYANPFVNDFSRTYASFDPNFFKRSLPVQFGVEKNAIYISDKNAGNGFDPTLRNAAAGYRGFMFACQSGTYRFESPYSDDITILWFGDKAFNSYTRDNADIIQFYYGDNRPMTV
ncbi:hypothetical protein K4F52_000068 [Lecanicillium sp. MT-2017a]|nr:hypothetical protein K4F52_000068 [Lecanicillium sp. MT-2017a]